MQWFAAPGYWWGVFYTKCNPSTSQFFVCNCVVDFFCELGISAKITVFRSTWSLSLLHDKSWLQTTEGSFRVCKRASWISSRTLHCDQQHKIELHGRNIRRESSTYKMVTYLLHYFPSVCITVCLLVCLIIFLPVSYLALRFYLPCHWSWTDHLLFKFIFI